MLHAVASVACALGCGLGFRVRGGLLERWNVPGQLARLIFAVAVSFTTWVAGARPELALLLVPAWWVSCLPGWWGAIDTGRNDGIEWTDFLLLGVRGLVWTLLPAALVWVSPTLLILQGAHAWLAFDHPRWWALIVAGLCCPGCYWLGRQSGLRLPGLGAGGFPEVGEAVWGTALGAAMIASVIP